MALQWHEDNPVAYHIRRRLTDAEQRQYQIWVEDLRGTPEARRRRGLAEKNGVPAELLWRLAGEEQAI